MERYHNNVQDQFGNAIGSVTVTVRLVSSGAIASIFSDDGVTPKSNPFTSQGDGELFFYAANDRYNIFLTGPITDQKDDVILFDIDDVSAAAEVNDLEADGVTWTTTNRVRTDIDTATPPTTEAVTGGFAIRDNEDVDDLFTVGFEGDNDLYFRNWMRGGEIFITYQTAGGVVRNVMEANPGSGLSLRAQTNFFAYVNNAEPCFSALANSYSSQYHNALEETRTALAADGGFIVDNQYNGPANFDRALTAMDISQGLNILNHSFSTGVGGGDPGSGVVAFDNATPASITEVTFDDLGIGGLSSEWLLGIIEAGDVLTFRNEQVTTDIIILQATGVAVDQGGFWEVPVRFISGIIPANSSNLRIWWHHNSQPLLKGYAIVNNDLGVVSDANQTLTFADGPVFEMDLENWTANRTITISGGPVDGTQHGQVTVKITQDGTSARTITWAGGTFVWREDTEHTLNATLNGISIYTFETWDGGTTWYAAGANYGP